MVLSGGVRGGPETSLEEARRDRQVAAEVGERRSQHRRTGNGRAGSRPRAAAGRSPPRRPAPRRRTRRAARTAQQVTEDRRQQVGSRTATGPTRPASGRSRSRAGARRGPRTEPAPAGDSQRRNGGRRMRHAEQLAIEGVDDRSRARDGRCHPAAPPTTSSNETARSRRGQVRRRPRVAAARPIRLSSGIRGTIP